jgi:hypothetical protein
MLKKMTKFKQQQKKISEQTQEHDIRVDGDGLPVLVVGNCSPGISHER